MDLPNPPRRPLKMELESDDAFARLVRSLERIADGVEGIMETLDAVIVRLDGERDGVRVTFE